MTTIDCPACTASRPAPRTRITNCAACSHQWMLNSETEHDATAEALYSHHDYSGYRDDPAFRRTIRDTFERHLVPRVAPGAQLLDVGCGAGDLLQAAAELGYVVRGIDMSPASAEICRGKGLNTVADNFLTYDFGQKFDLITMWDVMEHLHDPSAFLNRVQELLAPGGHFFAKVPGFGTLSVGIARHVPRTAGILLSAPDHVQYFNTRSLGALAGRMGFAFDWLPIGRGTRTAPKGGSLKRRVARRTARAIRDASGDVSIYLAATARD